MATYGIEEEVFIVEPTKPTTQSLYYLSKLVWQKPKKYLLHTDSNFARSKDILQGLMSAVEISTFIHKETTTLIEDLYSRRQELSNASEGLVLAIGHLLDYDAPTNTAALQFHIGDLEDIKRTYDNLVYFLPALILMTANSPMAGLKYHSKSYRLLNSYAVGPLKKDWSFRFQDIIFAKRTKTIEIRAFDPVWEIGRVKKLINIIDAIVNYPGHFELDLDSYNRLRQEACTKGLTPLIEERLNVLSQITEIDKLDFAVSPADIVYKYYEKNGLENTYLALDYGYLKGVLRAGAVPKVKRNVLKSLAGFAGYYIPKLPYDIWKYLQER